MRPSMQRCVSTVMKPVMVNSRAKSRNDLFVCTQIENSCNLSIRVNRSLQVSATSRLLHLARPIGLSDGLNKFIFENRKKTYIYGTARDSIEIPTANPGFSTTTSSKELVCYCYCYFWFGRPYYYFLLSVVVAIIWELL